MRKPNRAAALLTILALLVYACAPNGTLLFARPADTATSLPTAAPTDTVPPTASPTATATPTITRTSTPSLTPSRTLTPTITLTPTKTGTPTRTPTVTRTATRTRTPTATRRPTSTRGPTKPATLAPRATATSPAVIVDTQPPPPPDTQPAADRHRTGAQCVDGTTSSATGRGACSHHGGVSCWFYSDGTCTKP